MTKLEMQMGRFLLAPLLVGIILLSCSEEETSFNNRLQIYLNDELAEEYIYTEDSLLLVETSYYQPLHVSIGGFGGLNKETGIVYKYDYNELRNVDHIEISDLVGNYVRNEVYLYKDGKLDAIRIYFPHVKPLNSPELLDYIQWGFTYINYVDSADFVVEYQDNNIYRYHELIVYDIDRINVNPYTFRLTYDDKKNPFRKMRFSRITPFRLSMNNPVNIITGCTAGCGTSEYDFQYEYNEEGFPENLMIIEKHTGDSRSLRYVYDKVPK